MVNVDRMLAQLELHEGFRPCVYRDTEGNETIGIGYNVTDRGLDEFSRTVGRKLYASIDCVRIDEARRQCTLDIARVQSVVRLHFSEFDALSEVRQRVCVDIAFNIGLRALTFVKCIAAIKARDWSRAARELYASKWHEQVGDERAGRLAHMLLTGEDYAA